MNAYTQEEYNNHRANLIFQNIRFTGDEKIFVAWYLARKACEKYLQAGEEHKARRAFYHVVYLATVEMYNKNPNPNNTPYYKQYSRHIRVIAADICKTFVKTGQTTATEENVYNNCKTRDLDNNEAFQKFVNEVLNA